MKQQLPLGMIDMDFTRVIGIERSCEVRVSEHAAPAPGREEETSSNGDFFALATVVLTSSSNIPTSAAAEFQKVLAD